MRNEKNGSKKREIPNFLFDKEGNAYEMIYHNHKDGFNLETYRLDFKDYNMEV